ARLRHHVSGRLFATEVRERDMVALPDRLVNDTGPDTARTTSDEEDHAPSHRRRMDTQLMPPKPKEFLSSVRISSGVEALPTHTSMPLASIRGSSSSTLIEGCTRPAFIWRMAATVSTAGAAQHVCPSMDLGAFTFRRLA